MVISYAARTGDGQTEPAETMTELFYWKEIERRARAAQALAMLHTRADTAESVRSSGEVARAAPSSFAFPRRPQA
jgi:hypothetical protein